MTSCYDEKMDWHTPEGHGAVVSSDIPLELAEKIANYDFIKNYAAQYMPETKIGLGISADIYTDIAGSKNYNEAYAEVANANFQMFTPGNAMKHQSVVKSNGVLDFSTVTPFILQANAAGIEVFGHNFIWHTQQQQTYMKSMIMPTLVVETDSDIKNMITGDSFNFEGGTTGKWGCWGGNNPTMSVSDEGDGYESSYSLKLSNPEDAGSGNAWKAQCAYTFDLPLEQGVEYTIRFKAKSSSAAGVVQFQYQNSQTYGSQGGYHSFNVGTDWTTCEFTFTMPNADDDRIILNFGEVAADYYIDEIEFGVKEEDPMENVMTGDASDFEGGTTGKWGCWGGNNPTMSVSDEGDGYESSYSLKLSNPEDAGSGNAWKAQCAYTFDVPLEQNKKYIIQFYAKSTSSAGTIQFQFQNSSTYGSQGGYNSFNIGTEWVLCEHEFTMPNADDDRIILNFGEVAADYYIDNIKFGLAKDQGDAAARQRALHRAAKSYYVLKTAEEKREALLGAMKEWIEGMAAACPTVKGWDVINEPISDSNHKWRGVKDDDGSVTFGMDGDSEPTETTEEGLNLNWVNDAGNAHFYWGYYIGKDYAVKAFEYARAAIGSDAKLYVNEYGLETSPGKTAALIDFVNYIDQNGGQVDGIGTQMHITLSGTSNDADNNAEKVAELREKVDAMFKTLAATGKLVRVSELDIAFGTSNGQEVSPSAAQYAAQSDAYQAVMESYKENVPASQRGGFVIWTLSDNKNEHEYWLKGDKPNLFDKNYARKHAYKGLCDGIAGFDISTDFSGNQWNVK